MVAAGAFTDQFCPEARARADYPSASVLNLKLELASESIIGMIAYKSSGRPGGSATMSVTVTRSRWKEPRRPGGRLEL